MSPPLPETPQGGDQAQSLLVTARGQHVAQRRSDVIVLDLEPVEPPLRLGPGEVGYGLLRAQQEGVRVAGPNLVLLAAGAELLEGKLADHVEHEKTGLVGVVGRSDEVVVDEGFNAGEHIEGVLASCAADRLDVGKEASAGKDRQSRHQCLDLVVEQVITPGDGAAQSLLTFREVPGAAR